MATSSKGKAPAVHGRDWRYRIDYELQRSVKTEQELGTLRCPFFLTPERTEEIPNTYTAGLVHMTSKMDNGVPWTGYYAQYRGVPLAVANAYGVWFEVHMREGKWEAHRRAQPSLKLNDWPCTGIDFPQLDASGAPLKGVSGLHRSTAAPFSPKWLGAVD
jgi:hypothetical protein